MSNGSSLYQEKHRPWHIALRVLLCCLLPAVIAFVFSNSMRTGEASGALSQQVTAWVSGAEQVQPNTNTPLEGVVRKLGHMAEFSLLGLVLAFTLRAFTRRVLAYSAWPLLCGLLVAVLDEFIQKLVPGRSSSVQDVALDFASVVLGLALGLLVAQLLGGRRKGTKS